MWHTYLLLPSSVFMADIANHSGLSFLLNLDVASPLSITLQEATTNGLKMTFSVKLICSPCSQTYTGVLISLSCYNKNTIDWVA